MLTTTTTTPTERGLVERVRKILRPPRKRTLLEWADTKRKLSADSSGSPGQYSSARTPYMRDVMLAVSDPDIKEITLIAGAQNAKTTLIENICGYYVAQEPAPILVIQPTLEMAETFSKDRLTPMFRDTPSLRGKVKDARARDSGNTLLHKTYPGGQITIAGANSPVSLASRPKRVVLFDEVDRYPPSAGPEGDPVDLGKARTTAFHNKKLIYVSTPGNAATPGQEATRGTSRIFPAFESGDQRYYMVACPHCDQRQRLLWRQVKWQDGKPETAEYMCEHCGVGLTDLERRQMCNEGVWVATKPFNGHASFHISTLYSPFVTLEELAKEFLEKKAHKERLKVFVNTRLAELWEEHQGEGENHEQLAARVEPYKPLTVPAGGLLLTAGVDVQDNRLAVKIKAWGRGEESWLVYWTELYGDPSGDGVWAQLDDLLINTEYEHASGARLRITATAVDSGGHHTQRVYAYCWDRREHNIIAIKGSSTPGQAIRGKPAQVDVDHRGRKVRNALVWFVGTDTAKAQIYARQRQKDGSAGRMHWYVGLDTEYFQQLTAEKRVKKFYKGYERMEWVKTRARNEALDCEVYALAAAHHAGIQRVNWDKLEERLTGATSRVPLSEQVSPDTTSEPEAPTVSAEPQPQRREPVRPRGRGQNWVTGWKQW